MDSGSGDPHRVDSRSGASSLYINYLKPGSIYTENLSVNPDNRARMEGTIMLDPMYHCGDTGGLTIHGVSM